MIKSEEKEWTAPDLGFGNDAPKRSEARLLNIDGTFNVKRTGLSFFRNQTLYQYCIRISWAKFLGLILLVYLALNLVFGSAYFLLGKDGLNGLKSPTIIGHFLECFFFSVQTLATIGYGQIGPNNLTANFIVTFEAITGLMTVALATGLFFARFSRPTAQLLYSKNALISPYRSGYSLQFRVANERNSQLLHLSARVLVSRREKVGNDRVRRFHELKLERDQVLFLPLNWNIVHIIDETSPLYKVTERELLESEAEFLVLINGMDDSYSQTVYSRTSYLAEDLVWNARFSNMLSYADDGTVYLNLEKISDYTSTSS
ncbi:hypothetical protein JNK13_08735 [bacterium]|nr:hypothetical protein [bacterium]